MPQDVTDGGRDLTATLYAEVARTAPLVHCVTNLVAANQSANAVLAVGGSPAMVEDPDEAGEVAATADALVVNTGTMDRRRAEGMRTAVDAAVRAGTPWLLDPVGVGAASLRTEVARDLLGRGPSAVRGNASEIRVLAGSGTGGRGVDAGAAVEDALADAGTLAASSGAAVAVSGPRDVVCDGDTRWYVGGGDPLMARVTGVGCALGAIMGAFLAAAARRGATNAEALVAATALVGATGRDAAAVAAGPGSFVPAWMDRLAAPDAAGVVAGLIERVEPR